MSLAHGRRRGESKLPHLASQDTVLPFAGMGLLVPSGTRAPPGALARVTRYTGEDAVHAKESE